MQACLLCAVCLEEEGGGSWKNSFKKVVKLQKRKEN